MVSLVYHWLDTINVPWHCYIYCACSTLTGARDTERKTILFWLWKLFFSLSLFLFHFDPNIKIYVYQRCSLPERSFVSFVNLWGVENIYHRKHITKAHRSIMLKYLWLLHFWFALFFNGGTHSMRAKAKVLCVHGVILVCLFENAIPWIKYANENFKCAETISQIERWKKVRLNQSVIILNGMPFFPHAHIKMRHHCRSEDSFMNCAMYSIKCLFLVQREAECA